MKTLVLSDVHLGSPLVTNKLELIALIRSSKYDRIVLNGDIFDTWEQTFFSIILNNFDFVQSLKEVSKEKLIYYIMGNHDPDKKDLQKTFPDIVFSEKIKLNGDVLIIHGHEFDSLVTKYSWFAKLIFIPNWYFERLFHWNLKAFFRKLFYSISNKSDKKYFNKLIGDIEQQAVEKYKNECRYLIIGHTHTPKIVEGEECTYINCGDIIHNKTCIEFDETKQFKFIGV
jgi:UDP-2,3-diacylglucosamine pyrophosphatase LpxH